MQDTSIASGSSLSTAISMGREAYTSFSGMVGFAPRNEHYFFNIYCATD